jgi:hypothetical protein
VLELLLGHNLTGHHPIHRGPTFHQLLKDVGLLLLEQLIILLEDVVVLQELCVLCLENSVVLSKLYVLGTQALDLPGELR